MFAYSTLKAQAHIRIDVCLRCESLSSTLPIQLLSSPPPAWLLGPHHSPRSKPGLDKAALKTWKKPTRKKLRYIGGAKYLIPLSIEQCHWVVYAVNTGDKPMGTGHNNNILSAPEVRRPTGKMPDYQSSPGCCESKVPPPPTHTHTRVPLHLFLTHTYKYKPPLHLLLMRSGHRDESGGKAEKLFTL